MYIDAVSSYQQSGRVERPALNSKAAFFGSSSSADSCFSASLSSFSDFDFRCFLTVEAFPRFFGPLLGSSSSSEAFFDCVPRFFGLPSSFSSEAFFDCAPRFFGSFFASCSSLGSSSSSCTAFNLVFLAGASFFACAPPFFGSSCSSVASSSSCLAFLDCAPPFFGPLFFGSFFTSPSSSSSSCSAFSAAEAFLDCAPRFFGSFFTSCSSLGSSSSCLAFLAAEAFFDCAPRFFGTSCSSAGSSSSSCSAAEAFFDCAPRFLGSSFTSCSSLSPCSAFDVGFLAADLPLLFGFSSGSSASFPSSLSSFPLLGARLLVSRPSYFCSSGT